LLFDSLCLQTMAIMLVFWNQVCQALTVGYGTCSGVDARHYLRASSLPMPSAGDNHGS
jgi:hypothetical protein